MPHPLGFLLGVTIVAASISGQGTTLVSVDSAGVQADGYSFNAQVSADGRCVAFESRAANLVPGDTNGVSDVFVFDRVAGTTTRVSVSSAGEQGSKDSQSPAISADGRFVAFRSQATELAGLQLTVTQVFVHDRATGMTTLVTLGTDSLPANHHCGLYGLTISGDGTHVAFSSKASNLAGPTGVARQVFVTELATGSTAMASLGISGGPGSGDSDHPALSADGARVGFESLAADLVADDTNAGAAGFAGRDVFVHDLGTSTTERVSVSSQGVEGNGDSSYITLSADGRIAAFQSSAYTLVTLDTSNVDIFVRDLDAGLTAKLSFTSGGGLLAHPSVGAALSADGRWVAWQSNNEDIVPGDDNSRFDVFLHDRVTGLTSRISITDGGGQADGHSSGVSLSADGRFAAFESDATNLVDTDTNDNMDLFLRDRGPFTHEGCALAGVSGLPSLSGEGSLLALAPGALNLVAAAPSAPAGLLASLSSTPAPFKGGTLKPLPVLLFLPLVTDATGSILLGFDWPSGVPSGTDVWFQTAILDPVAVQGVALSNALRAHTP